MAAVKRDFDRCDSGYTKMQRRRITGLRRILGEPTMEKWTIALVFAISAAGANAQSGSERIAFPPLEGLVSGYHVERDENAIEEFVPRGETVQAWSRMVTVQRFGNVPASVTPSAYVQNIASNLLPSSCPNARASTVTAAMVSGRIAARFRADCPRNPQTGRPETFFLLAIDGNPGLHVFQVAFRSVPTTEEIAWSETQLAAVVLCDTGEQSPLCK